jgi:hypothetical protein
MHTITLTESEYLSAAALFAPKRKRERKQLIFCAVLFIIGIVALIFNFEITTIIALGGSFGCLIGILGNRILHPRRLRKIFQQQQALRESYIISWSNEGVMSKSDRGSILSPWPHYHGWQENQDVLLLIISDAMFQIIPKRSFETSSELEDFKQHISNHMPA